MTDYKSIVYMVLDELKLISDDSHFTEEHILFLVNKLRAFLLEKKYSGGKVEVNASNYQEICFDLEETPAIAGTPCAGIYLKSTIKIPSHLNIGIPQVYSDYMGNFKITMVPLERMPFVGASKWLKDFIYVAKGPDGYLYLKSANPLFLNLVKLKLRAVFENPEQAEEYSCSNGAEDSCDVMDRKFPLEEALITPLIQYVVQELSVQRYMPGDTQNNAQDDLSGMRSPNARNYSHDVTQPQV